MVSVGVEDVIVGVSCWCSRKEQTKYFGLWLLFLCSTLVEVGLRECLFKKEWSLQQGEMSVSSFHRKIVI